MRLVRATGLLALTLLAAIASATLMAVLYDPGADPSRIYYGTDTRASALLFGAALV
jgi:peptidoglycan/LPS O-acetylase OafA/YrhL